MRIHLLVEGPSEAAFLESWMPRFLPGHAFSVIQHRGKGRLPRDPRQPSDPRRQGLLDQLPAKLRAYGKTLNPETDRVLVLVDLDQQDCEDLKRRLVEILEACDPRPVVKFRIAIEETEAFYLGDPEAVREAFPRARLYGPKDYVQDSICGTWELFARIIGASTEDKVGWAERMGPRLRIEWKGKNANRSPSFRQFCRALRELAGEATD